MQEQCEHGKVCVEDGVHMGCTVGFEVLMTVAMKITAIMDVTLCSLVDTHRHFGGTCYFISCTEDGDYRLLNIICALVPNSTCVYCMFIAEDVTPWHQHHHFR
jgi:hypothetical protein